jgi:predicted unusual protein kinase regulating ubiquinone biosynthesis (AarF/ABC1/UbiB family)
VLPTTSFPPTDEVFESFDAEHPLGSASIGQCHLARLKDGRLVAVKVNGTFK